LILANVKLISPRIMKERKTRKTNNKEIKTSLSTSKILEKEKLM